MMKSVQKVFGLLDFACEFFPSTVGDGFATLYTLMVPIR